jgi:hypothetical protein
MRRLFNLLQKAFMLLAMAAGTITVPAVPVFASPSWAASEDDAVLLDMRSGQYRIGNGVRGYQTNEGVCVDFADIVMALDLPVRIDKKSRRATGWLFEETRTFTLDREQAQVQIMNKNQPLAASDVYDTPEGWCVNTKALSRWLNVELIPDLTGAVLILKADRKLPFELAEERKARIGKNRPATKFDLSNLPQAKDPYRFWRTPSVDVVASASFQKDDNAPLRLNARYELYASGELAGASFDARLSSDERGVPERLRVRGYRSDPNGGLLGGLHATHFALGDVSISPTPLGIQSTAGRGGYITNRPLERADNFDKTSFRGDLPDGWDAELYHNDQLIRYVQSRGDGRYEFLDVPLLFGQNRFEVVLYGPQGQVRRDVRMIPVGPDSIPPRETYYWAGLQDAGRDLIQFSGVRASDNMGWRGGFGVERGIDARTSLAGSFTSAMFRGKRHDYLEGLVRRALGPALVQLSSAYDAAGGYAVQGQLLAQIGQTSISAESAWLNHGFISERFESGITRLHGLSLDQNIKIGGQYIPVHVESRYRKRNNGDRLIDIKTRLAFNIKSLAASTELIWETQKNAFGSDPPGKLDAALRLSNRIGKVRLRGEVLYGLSGSEKGLGQTKLTAEWRAGEKADWRLGLGYDAQTSQSILGLGYTQRFQRFALTGQVEATNRGAVTAGINLAFSFGPDPRGGVRFAAEKLATNGQALAIVFSDENADGIRQPSEPVEKEVELTAGLNGRGDPTDSKGQTIIDGLQPFQPVLIGIDASSLPDPFMQPANSGIVVTPRPGIPTIVELPLVAAGEISGTLQSEGGKILSGVEIELVDKTGSAVKKTRTEYDGFFLFESVPYGRYTLRIADLSATVVGVETILPGVAELGKGNPTVDIGTLVAKPSARLAAVTP